MTHYHQKCQNSIIENYKIFTQVFQKYYQKITKIPAILLQISSILQRIPSIVFNFTKLDYVFVKIADIFVKIDDDSKTFLDGICLRCHVASASQLFSVK